MRVFASFCIAIALWSTPAAGRDIFVDNRAGDDRFTGQVPHDGTQQNGPVQTITKALRLAVNGDAIVLANTNVPYRETTSLVGSRNSGLPGQPFIIRGNGAILDGSAPVPPEAWQPYCGAVFCFRPPHLAYQQLFLDDRPAVRVFASRTAKAPPELQPREWCLLGDQIYFCVEQTKLPSDYRLSYAAQQTGITLFHVDYVAIADLTVQGFQVDGINLFNSARHVSIIAVTCRGDGRSGLTVGGASAADIDLSLLGNNGESQLLTLPYSETHVRSTYLLGNTAPGWVDRGGRVYLGASRVEGGLSEVQPPAAQEQTP
jgi:hypothetical protein